jgi:hypothetical protein
MRLGLNRRSFVLGMAVILGNLSIAKSVVAAHRDLDKNDFTPAMLLPPSDKIVGILDAKGIGSPDGEVWFARAAHLVTAIWPAMILVAQHERRDVDADLYVRMRNVQGLEDFVRRFGGSNEAKAVSDCLKILPGYPQPDNRESFEIHFGFVEMSILSILVDQGYIKHPRISFA